MTNQEIKQAALDKGFTQVVILMTVVVVILFKDTCFHIVFREEKFLVEFYFLNKAHLFEYQDLSKLLEDIKTDNIFLNKNNINGK